MSDNDTDGQSVHDHDHTIPGPQEDSDSEYRSEDNQIEDDESENDAISIRSGSSNRSSKSSNTGSVRKRTAKKPVQPQIVRPSKATYSDTYRDFYNNRVEELTHPIYSRSSVLPSSELGVIAWTPLEKEILFQKISTLGKDNIKAISEAIRTKSETEVRQYLILLDQGVVEGNVTLALPVFSAADVSAAFEVSKHSEDLLEEYADGLAKYQLKGDQKREKKRHGDYWLLTEEIAEEVEEQVMARDGSYLESKVHADEEDEELEETKDDQDISKGNSPDGSEAGTKDEQDLPGYNNSTCPEMDKQSTEAAEELMVPAAELLDLPMWLRLSTLFMYQSPESGENWTNFVTSRHETPSMYHTAFQDFHNLAVSLTRRLVQATIFQTMTRLRARDKDQPSTTINLNDVRTAANILDLRSNTRKFWAGMPRRHGLRVYERGSKISKGQSRTGVELSLKEAEERLGIGQASTVNAETSDDVVHTVEDEMEDDVLDPDQYYEDPGLWTEASGSEDETPTTLPDDQQSNASGEDAADDSASDQEAQNPARTKRRTKGRMERNFRKAHDAYLEAMDQTISRGQEVEMWDTLGIPPPDGIKDEEIEIPRQPVIKRRLSDTVNWRDGFEYQPPWEQGLHDVQSEDFVKMQQRGEQGRKRRRLAYEHLEREGLVVIPQQTPEIAVVRKKTKSTDVDVEMKDAPTGEAAIASTESFDDGIPRKKHPKPILSRAHSRQGSVASSHSGSVRPAGPALANRLAKRTSIQRIETEAEVAEKKRKAEEALAEETRRAEEQAEEQAKEERRKAKEARKALPVEEQQAIAKQEKEERARKRKLERQREENKKGREEKREKKRLDFEEKQRAIKEKRAVREEEKQKAEDERQRAKEEKQRLKNEKRKARNEEQKAKEKKPKAKTPDRTAKRKRRLEDGEDDMHGEEQEHSKPPEETTGEDDGDPQETTRTTRSRSKKPKRKSGF